MFLQLNAADSLSESEVKEDDDLGDSVTQISLKALESQKRKQRNKKHKKKKPVNNKSSEDNLEDDVEKSVREVNRILGKNELRRVMPCPFTGPKMFWAGPNFLCQTKKLFTYCGSHKHFVPDKKMICIQ